jgi:hypothetical protein
MERPVALDGPEALRPVGDGADGEKAGRQPGVVRPDHRARRLHRAEEPSAPKEYAQIAQVQFPFQIGLEARRREIDRAGRAAPEDVAVSMRGIIIIIGVAMHGYIVVEDAESQGCFPLRIATAPRARGLASRRWAAGNGREGAARGRTGR